MSKKHPCKKWRVLAQDEAGNRVALECDGTEFDELAFALPGGAHFHIERMSNNTWFIGIGDKKVCFTATKRGIKIGDWYE